MGLGESGLRLAATILGDCSSSSCIQALAMALALAEGKLDGAGYEV